MNKIGIGSTVFDKKEKFLTFLEKNVQNSHSSKTKTTTTKEEEEDVDSMFETEQMLLEKCKKGGGGMMSMSMCKNEKELIGGCYLKGEYISKGGTGKVYKGVNVKTGELVAIKEMKLNDILNNIGVDVDIDDGVKMKMKQLNENEKNLLCSMDHKNIIKVKYIEEMENGNGMIIVMKYACGGDIKTFIRKTFKNVEERIKWFKPYMYQMLMGVNYIHENNVFHRDIKPANIFVSNGKIKIGDFGVSKVFCPENCSKQTFITTKEYASPEFIASEFKTNTKVYPFKVDIWSLGVSVIEILTGVFPFPIQPKHGTIKSHILELKKVEIPEIISSTDKVLADLISKCVEIDPLKRLNSSELLKHKYFLGDNGVTDPVIDVKPKDIDLVFVIDETGSMGTWIQSVKDNVNDIILKISESCRILRLSVVSYRDHPPMDYTFVTNIFKFHDAKNMKEIQDHIDGMEAEGGGDIPEALTAAMFELCRLEWKENAIKVAVVVTDAPPHGFGHSSDHFDEEPTGEDLFEQCESCKIMGITVHTVQCGDDELTKEILEKIAKTTNGVGVNLSDAQKLTDLIINGTSDAFDKVVFRAKVLECILENEMNIRQISTEKMRVEKVFDLLKVKVTRLKLCKELCESLESEIVLDDVIEAIRELKLESEEVNSLFKTTGICRHPLTPGLFTMEDVVIELKDVDVNINIFDGSAEVSIQQEFFNNKNYPVSTVYKFPVDRYICVHSFTAEVSGKKVFGKSLKKESVKRAKERALKEGKKSFMSEEVASEMFETKIGKIPPKKSCLITIKFIRQLECTSASLYYHKFVLPTHFAAKDKNTQYRISMKIASKKLYFDHECVSHELIKTNVNEFSFGETENGLLKDLVMLLKSNPKDDKVVLEKVDKKKNFGCLLDFVPSFESLPLEEIEKKETIFILVDCSSSLGYHKDQILIGLKKCSQLIQLCRNVQFNVIAFSSGIKMLFDNPKGFYFANEFNDMIEKIKFFGGSQMFRPVEKIAAQKIEEDIVPKVIYFGDGNVTGSKKIIDFVKGTKKLTFYPIAVGECVNECFLRKLADYTDGSVEFCLPHEDIENSVCITFKRIFQSLKDVSVNSKPLKMNIISGYRVNMFLLLDDKDFKNEIVLEGKNNMDKEVKVNFQPDFKKQQPNGPIHLIAAKELIKDLEMNEDGNKDKIIELANFYNIGSKFTSIDVVIKERKKYKVIKKIKNGVLHVKNDEKGEFVVKEVVKVSVDRKLIANLKKEVKVLEKLKSKCLVGYQGYEVMRRFSNKTCKKFHVFTEFLAGFKKITDVIKGEIKPKIYIQIFRNILEGLNYMHSKNILHLDISPARVFYDASNECAKLLIPLNLNGKSISEKMEKCKDDEKYAYFPPEMVFYNTERYRNAEFTSSFDIWSFGITILTILLKKYPFVDNFDTEFLNFLGDLKRGKDTTIQRLIDHNVKQCSSLDNDLNNHQHWKNLISSCLKCNPNDRLSAKELLSLPIFTQNPLHDNDGGCKRTVGLFPTFIK